MAADEVPVLLTRDQALVLFDWLARTSSSGHPVGFEDQSEQRVLWDLESALESALPETLRAEYRELVSAARARLRDEES